MPPSNADATPPVGARQREREERRRRGSHRSEHARVRTRGTPVQEDDGVRRHPDEGPQEDGPMAARDREARRVEPIPDTRPTSRDSSRRSTAEGASDRGRTRGEELPRMVVEGRDARPRPQATRRHEEQQERRLRRKALMGASYYRAPPTPLSGRLANLRPLDVILTPPYGIAPDPVGPGRLESEVPSVSDSGKADHHPPGHVHCP